jgi:cytochrome c oxidase assembly protein subunit 15
VQFDHRMAAYAIFVVAVLHALDAWRNTTAAARPALVLAAAITLQAVLGILTLVHQVPILLALAHQAMAMIALTLAALHAARLSAVRQAATATSTASAR